MWRAKGGYFPNNNGPGPAPISEINYAAYSQAVHAGAHPGPGRHRPDSPCVGNSAHRRPQLRRRRHQGQQGLPPRLAGPELRRQRRGLRLSATEIVRYLAHLRHGTIVHPDDLKTMDDLRVGWAAANNKSGEPAGARWHGGAFNGDGSPRSGPAA